MALRVLNSATLEMKMRMIGTLPLSYLPVVPSSSQSTAAELCSSKITLWKKRLHFVSYPCLHLTLHTQDLCLQPSSIHYNLYYRMRTRSPQECLQGKGRDDCGANPANVAQSYRPHAHQTSSSQRTCYQVRNPHFGEYKTLERVVTAQ